MILSEFQAVGRGLFARGLVSSQSGNLSIRLGDKIIITRRGAMLGSLRENDLIETGVSRNNRATPHASIELPVHRAIYKATQASAIVHAHSPHVVALSLIQREIIPGNTEGVETFRQVPVVGWDEEVRAGGLGEVIADTLKEQRLVVVHGHGSFAIGQLLEEAYNLTSALEECCHVLCLLKTMGR